MIGRKDDLPVEQHLVFSPLKHWNATRNELCFDEFDEIQH
jgi:hypothetical protein